MPKMSAMPAMPAKKGAARETLEGCYFAAVETRVKERRIIELREARERARETLGLKAGGKAAAGLRRLAEEYAEDVGRLAARVLKAKRMIEGLENAKFRAILEMRYMEFMRWDDIAREMGYEVSSVYKMHRAAVAAAEEAARADAPDPVA